jgi:hypothetical protein
VHVREDALTPAIDNWLAQLFDDDHIADTGAALEEAAGPDIAEQVRIAAAPQGSSKNVTTSSPSTARLARGRSGGGVTPRSPTSAVSEGTERAADLIEFLDLELAGSLCQKRAPYRLQVVKRRHTLIR